MSNEEYQMIQDFLMAQASMFECLDLQGFIDKNLHADSVGAVLDPTLYRKGWRKLDAIRDLAIAAHGFVGSFQKLKETP